uniref:Uncharacterized protein n=1 Tax=Opuntia streptacantha TaxID=393608 RepID=A0A7C8Z4F1_OPUST
MYQETSEKNGLKEMGNQKITVPDHRINGLKNEDGVSKSDTFIVDLDSFSSGLDRDSTTNATSNINSRITLQRSLSRKAPQRVAERKINDRDDPLAPSSSPRAVQVVTMPEQSLLPSALPMGSPDLPKTNQLQHQHQHQQHQITIKTGGVSTIAADGRWGNRSSFKRSPRSWFLDPKRILLLFATLSSMGTILLIYFALSMKNPAEKEDVLEWQ